MSKFWLELTQLERVVILVGLSVLLSILAFRLRGATTKWGTANFGLSKADLTEPRTMEQMDKVITALLRQVESHDDQLKLVNGKLAEAVRDRDRIRAEFDRAKAEHRAEVEELRAKLAVAEARVVELTKQLREATKG